MSSSEVNKKNFICPTCGKALSSSYNLKVHIESNCSTVKNYDCQICHKKFLTNHSLNTHIKSIHTDDKKFMCSYCTKRFSSKGQLQVHERSHTKSRPFSCSICDKKFSHRESLVTHSTTHTKIKPYECECCHQTFSCVGNLIKHRKIRPDTCGQPIYTNKKVTKRTDIQISTKTSPLKDIEVEREAKIEIISIEIQKCEDLIQENVLIEQDTDIMNVEFPETQQQNVEFIEDHLEDNLYESNNYDDEVAYEENVNKQALENDDNIDEYLLINDQQQYCCKLCPKIYQKKNISIKHLKKDHQIELKNYNYENTSNRYRKPQRDLAFSCKYCRRKFTSAKLLEKHQINHGVDGNLIYKCSCCRLYFETQTEVESHQNSVHEDRLKCNIADCSKRFDHPEKLLSHKKYAHSSKKNVVRKKYIFMCTRCGRNFNTRVAMSDHERSECGKKPIYECNYCNKKYHTAGILKCHMKIHTKELNFLCNSCSKKFRTKGQLIIHQRTHTKIKPYKCQLCDASFAHRESLLTHHTTHSGIKRFECEACHSQFSCISNLLAHKKSRQKNSCGNLTHIQKVKNAKTTLGSVNQIIE